MHVCRVCVRVCVRARNSVCVCVCARARVTVVCMRAMRNSVCACMCVRACVCEILIVRAVWF